VRHPCCARCRRVMPSFHTPKRNPQSGINRTQNMPELRQARARLRSIRRRDRQATLLIDRLTPVSLTSRHMVAATILPCLTCHPSRTDERRVGAMSMAGEYVRELSKVDTAPCFVCARVKRGRLFGDARFLWADLPGPSVGFFLRPLMPQRRLSCRRQQPTGDSPSYTRASESATTRSHILRQPVRLGSVRRSISR